MGAEVYLSSDYKFMVDFPLSRNIVDSKFPMTMILSGQGFENGLMQSRSVRVYGGLDPKTNTMNRYEIMNATLIISDIFTISQ